MRINKYLVLAIVLISLLSIAAASQISDTSGAQFYPSLKTTKATDKIDFGNLQDCKTISYNETQDVYGNVTKYGYTRCLNPSNQSYYDCLNESDTYQSYEVIGRTTIPKTREECVDKNAFQISIKRKNEIINKEIDFSGWGACIHETKDNCLIVTCVSLYDGAHNGKFTNCNGGKSCQRFEICENSIETYYKNSREDFVEYDPTFFLNKLEMAEVAK